MRRLIGKRGRFALLLSLVMLMAGIFMTTEAAAAQHTVSYSGQASDGTNTAGRFTVGGNLAFCCDHAKITPQSGTRMTMSYEEDADIAKALYYGYGGPEMWSGFKDDEEAIVGTSLALDHWFNGGNGYGSSVFDRYMKFLDTKDSSRSGTSYILYTSTESSLQRLVAANPPVTIEVTVNKKSADTDLTEDNGCYSLKGARYGVYSGGELLTAITTNEAGKASGEITVSADEAKEIVIKELRASEGYGRDDNTYKRDGTSGKITVTSKEPPAANPVDILLYKYDEETGKDEDGEGYTPQKGASLAGAVFRVDLYDIAKGQMPKDGDMSGQDPLDTWYFMTDAKGRIEWDESYLAEGYDQSEIYRDPAGGGGAVLPLGTVTIREVKAPEGYMPNDEVFVCHMEADGEKTVVKTYQVHHVPDEIKRGDLELVKISGDTSGRMAGIPFMITSLEENGKETDEGESHIVVTDDNGYFSTAGSFNSRSRDVNGNDDAWDGKKADGSRLKAERGVWFGEKSAVNDEDGALPYGRYRIDELPCDGNKGHELIKGIEIYVTRDGHVIEIGTLTNEKIKLETQLWDSEINEERETLPRDGMVLTDRVSYEGLEKGAEYTIKGVLMDKETGKPLVINGSEVESEKTFTAASADGKVDIEFRLDASSLGGKSIVAFERLIRDGVVIAKHEDMDDLDQTLEFLKPELKTTAKDGSTGSKHPVNSGTVTVIDEVDYSGLLRGYEYELTGVLMDKETGEPFLADGKRVTAVKKFEANRSSGSVDMVFTFDAVEQGERQLVVFETLRWDGDVIAEHHDIDDENQTVYLKSGKDVVPGTGDDTPAALLPALMIMTASCAVAAAVALRGKGA